MNDEDPYKWNAEGCRLTCSRCGVVMFAFAGMDLSIKEHQKRCWKLRGYWPEYSGDWHAHNEKIWGMY